MSLLTLDDPGLVRTDDGHEYRLSRPPDEYESSAFIEALHDREGSFQGATVEYAPRSGAVLVGDLTAENRAAVEAELATALTAANRARVEAETLAKGGEFGYAAGSPEISAAVDGSFGSLPSELPS